MERGSSNDLLDNARSRWLPAKEMVIKMIERTASGSVIPPWCSIRFTVRTMLLATFVTCAGLALWKQHRQLETANAVLVAHGLRWSLEPPSESSFRVFVNDVLDERNIQVRKITVESLGDPKVVLVLGEEELLLQQHNLSGSSSDEPWQTQLTISAFAYILPGGENQPTIQTVEVSAGGESVGREWKFTRIVSERTRPDISDVLQIKVTSGEYPRGQPIELFELNSGSKSTEVLELMVK